LVPPVDQLPSEVYVAQAVDHAVPSNGVGVLVIHDIFGTQIPNTKYIADHFASQGYTAIVPNFFKKVGAWPATEAEALKPLGTPDFFEWFSKITSDDFWSDDFGPEMRRAAGYLKDLGCAQLCVIGFCWGGKAAAISCRSGYFHAGVSSHGVAHDTDDVLNSRCPEEARAWGGPKGGLLFQRPEVDDYFPDAAAAEIRAAGGWVTTYEGVDHGFVTRGDFANDQQVKKSADSAMAEAVKFFQDTVEHSRYLRLQERSRVGPSALDSCVSEGHLGWCDAKPRGKRTLAMSWGRALAREDKAFYKHWGKNAYTQKPSQASYLANVALPANHLTGYK